MSVKYVTRSDECLCATFSTAILSNPKNVPGTHTKLHRQNTSDIFGYRATTITTKWRDSMER